MILVLFAVHNYIFLSIIYQRRWSSSNHRKNYIAINLLDRVDRCFGFKDSQQIFNLQVIVTAIIGCIILVSRFSNVSAEQNQAMQGIVSSIINKGSDGILEAVGNTSFTQLFPDLGQWLLAICWTILFLTVFMPALIKLLPAFPNPLKHLRLIPYLKEFIPDGEWKKGGWEFGNEPTPDQERTIVDEVAFEFAENSFWPNGDNTAKISFYLAILVFLIMIFPFKYSIGKLPEFLTFYTSLAILSGAITAIIFYGIRYYLWFVSPYLVKKSKGKSR